jgi:hypothetical protein
MVRFPVRTITSRQSLMLTQSPFQKVSGALSTEVMRPRRETGHSPTFSVEVKNNGVYLHSPTLSIMHRDILYIIL